VFWGRFSVERLAVVSKLVTFPVYASKQAATIISLFLPQITVRLKILLNAYIHNTYLTLR